MASTVLRPLSKSAAVGQVRGLMQSLLLTLLRHREVLVIGAILLAGGAAHAINLFDYPYYFDDEGTYMAQAWAVVREGNLAPYTYWYDHAPIGWIQIAIWTVLTGGFYSFGTTTVDSGRVLMVLLQVGSTLMVYLIARNVSRSVTVAVIASLLFSFSGYGIFWHRRVMLDNIATFWMLLSILLLVAGRPSLKRVWLSAVSLGISVLSKEITAFLVPALTYLAYYQVHRTQRWFAGIGWPAVAGSIISLYVLMAALKGELFPTGTFLGGTSEHVSLLGTLEWQASRYKDGGFLDAGSMFWATIRGTWGVNDPLLVIGGTACAIGSIALIRQHRVLGILGLASIALWVFIARGGLVNDQFLVPLLPLLALNVALVAGIGAGKVRPLLTKMGSFGRALLPAARLIVVSAALVGVSFSYLISDPLRYWTASQAVGQRDALQWMLRNLPPSSSIVMDASALIDLREPAGEAQPFPLAHHYWKVDLDPEVREGVFEADWRNIDYVVAHFVIKNEAQRDQLKLVRSAIDHSTVIAQFDTGWNTEVRRVNKLHRIEASSDPVLVRTWETSKADFLRQGRVVSSRGHADTSASSQVSALLQAVYVDDRRAFDALWGWAQEYLRVGGDRLAGGWDPEQGAHGEGSIATEQELALTLLFASERWNAAEYRAHAGVVLDRLWNRMAPVAGQFLPGAPPAELGIAVRLVTSDLAPHAYRIFAQADPSHDWGAVVDASFGLLRELRGYRQVSEPAAVPEWVSVAASGEIVGVSDVELSSAGLARLAWNLTLDWLWSGDLGAKRAILGLLPSSVAASEPEDVGPAAAVTIMGLLASSRQEEASRIFAERILSSYQDSSLGSSLSTSDDELDRLWAWYCTALMDGAMANIWEGQRTIDWTSAAVAGSG